MTSDGFLSCSETEFFVHIYGKGSQIQAELSEAIFVPDGYGLRCAVKEFQVPSRFVDFTDCFVEVALYEEQTVSVRRVTLPPMYYVDTIDVVRQLLDEIKKNRFREIS